MCLLCPTSTKHHRNVSLCSYRRTKFPNDLFDKMAINLNIIDTFMIYWILGNSELLSQCKIIGPICLNSILVTISVAIKVHNFHEPWLDIQPENLIKQQLIVLLHFHKTRLATRSVQITLSCAPSKYLKIQ